MKKNKFSPLVSVIMNCYNGAKYLDESIQSVISQTYDNWELIFWDNRSEDKSSEIFKKYQDKRFKYFYANKHATLYKARNLAIEKSKGDFIAFLDTDDTWSKDKLNKNIEFDEKIS
jgi:glycosyltransferase involved in cell wall biosynthesis